MHRALRSIICGTLAALIVGGSVFAVGAGGFPSRPRIVALGIGTAPPTLGGAIIAGPGYALSYADNSAAAIGVSGIDVGTDSGSNSANPSVMWVDGAATANNHVWECRSNFSAAYDFACIARPDTLTGGAMWLDVKRSGATVTAVNFPGGNVEFLGEPAGAFAATVTVSSSACSIVSQGAQGYYTGCTRLNIGKYSVSFSNFTQSPHCVADTINLAGYIVQTQIATASSIEVDVVNGSNGTFFDANGTVISLMCSYQ